MTARRYVFLDPDGMAGGTGWLYVVVHAETGVCYQQQYGGTACRQGQVEGFLVPVFGPDSLAQLRDLFECHFRGAGTWNYQWSTEEVNRLRKAVAGICYWACDGETEAPRPLQLDERQLSEADEAWIPVFTPDGSGILVWFNSD
jgi:hypothetical protein